MTGIVDLDESILADHYPQPVSLVDTSLVRRTIPDPRQVERTPAHLVFVTTSGRGHHLVDFERHELAPGRVLHVQPGQVQQFDVRASFEADIVIVRPVACPPGLFRPGEPAPSVELGASWPVVSALTADLRRQLAGDHPSPDLVVATAQLILRQVAAAAGGVAAAAPTSQMAVLRDFRAELERRFPSRHDVGYYARTVGTSPRSLARITRSLTGQTPKQIIDDRRVLEAKRLLVHTDDTAAAIGRRIGFSEATNFTKFFTRATGTSPQRFRSTAPAR